MINLGHITNISVASRGGSGEIFHFDLQTRIWPFFRKRATSFIFFGQVEGRQNRKKFIYIFNSSGIDSSIVKSDLLFQHHTKWIKSLSKMKQSKLHQLSRDDNEKRSILTTFSTEELNNNKTGQCNKKREFYFVQFTRLISDKIDQVWSEISIYEGLFITYTCTLNTHLTCSGKG